MANELELKYGCNPNQKPARIFMKEGELPIEVLNGRPGYINLLDAFNSWQLVKELKEATGLPAAASFKHVSPAGAAVAVEMSDTLKKIYFVDDMKPMIVVAVSPWRPCPSASSKITKCNWQRTTRLRDLLRKK